MRVFFSFLIMAILYSNSSYSTWLEGDIAVFQGLDKITARIKSLEFEVKRIA